MENSRLGNGQAEVKGLLKEIREIPTKDKEKLYEHLIVEPAKDEYSHPRTFPVCSRAILGGKGSIVEVVVNIQSWFSRGFYNMRLWAVEG